MSRLVYLDGSILSRMADDPVSGHSARALKHNRNIMAAAGVLSLIENRGLQAVTSWHAIEEIDASEPARRGRILKSVPAALKLLPRDAASDRLAGRLRGRPFSEKDAVHAAYACVWNALLLTTDGGLVRGARSCVIVKVEAVDLFDWIRDDYSTEARPVPGQGKFPREDAKRARRH